MLKKLKRFSNIIFYSFRLSGNFFSFFIFLFLFFSSKFINKFREVKLKIKFENKKFNFYITDRSDLSIIEEMFIMEEYKIDDIDPSVIFDIGSNVGLSSIYFSLKYPNSQIYSFEPNKKTFLKMEKNVRNFNNIKVFNWAIADHDGQVEFFENERSMSSSIIKRSDGQEAVLVDCYKLDSVFEKLNINKVDLLKFDVEGFEYNIFNKFTQWSKVSYFIGEVHLDLMKENMDQFSELFNFYKIDLHKNSERRFVFKAIN